MAASRTNPPSRYIVQQVLSCAKALIDYSKSKQLDTFVENFPLLNQFLWCLERLLQEGFIVGFFKSNDLWDYVRRLVECAPGTEEVIDQAKNIAKTSLGRVRMFFRLSLNEGAISDYLYALALNRKLSEEFYDETAIVRSLEEFTSIVEQIKQLTNSIHFVLWTKDSDGVDNPRYWEITPRFIEEKTNVMFVSPNVSELELAKRELARQTKLSNRTSNSTPIPPQPTKETLPPSTPKPEVKVEPVTEIVVSSPRSSNPRSPPLSPSSGPQRSESPAPAQIEAAPALPELGEEEAKWLEKQQRTLEMLHTLTDFTLVALPIEQPPSAGGAKPKTKRKAKIANIDNPDEQGGLPADPQTSPVSPDEEDLNVKKTHHLSLEFLPNHFPQMPHPSNAYNSPHQSLPPPIKKSPSEENLHSNHRSPEKPRTLGKEIERMQRDQNRNTKVKTKLLNQNVKAIKTLETEQKLNRILSDDEQVNEKFDQILQKHELSSKKFKKPTWQNDREVTKCSDCTKPFSVVRRKHHCRCCGKIYCAECCSHKRTLPPHMGYTSPQLACNSCIYQHSL